MKSKFNYVAFVFAILCMGLMSVVCQVQAQEKTEEAVPQEAAQLVSEMMAEESPPLDNQATQEVSQGAAVNTEAYHEPPFAEIIKATQQPNKNPEEGLPQQEQQEGQPRRISLDIKGMDIVDVLKLLSSEGRLNIVAGKNVAGRVSMFLKNVDVGDAFEIIIAANGLAYEKKGDIIEVMNARDYEVAYGKQFDDKKVLRTYKLQYANAKDVSAVLNLIKSALGKVVVDEASNTVIFLDVPERIKDMEEIISETDTQTPLQTKIIQLNYADPEKLTEKLQEVLTKGIGMIKTDKRTNKLVVIDYPNKLAKIEEIVKAFDEKTPQVLIEAKIIQVTLSDTYKMGIDWKYVASQGFKFTAFNISRALNTQGAQLIAGEDSPAAKNEYRAILDMLKTFGEVRTLSTPRITATDGQEAKILVGSKEVYVSDTTIQGDTTQTIAESINFVDVGVKLYVTPTINRDGFITMKIRPEVSSATREFTKQDGTKIPIVSTTEAETSVLVKDGVTLVMGGLMKNERTENVHKLPLLGEIPFLGALFRRTEDAITKTELVIFLTPHIISGDEKLLESER